MTDSMIPPPPPKADEPGVIDDLLEIFTSPTKVFTRRAKGGGGAMFFIVAIAMAALGYTSKPVLDPIMETQIVKSMEANPRVAALPAEQKAAAMATQRKFFAFSYVLGPAMILFFTGLFAWVFAKVFGAAVTFGGSLVIASLAFVPRMIGSVLTNVTALMADDVSRFTNMAQLSVGPARFLDPATTSNVVMTALARVDVLVIWSTILFAIAWSTWGKLPKAKAYAAAGTFWLVAGLFAVWGASRAP